MRWHVALIKLFTHLQFMQHMHPCNTMPPHRLWERAHPAHGPHGHQGLVWAAIWPTLILWNQAQDQCSPHSSPHKGLIAMWPLHRVGPFTWPVRGQSIVAVSPPHPHSRLGGAKGIALQKHAKHCSAATHNLSVVLQHKWGKVAVCNKKVME